MGLESLIGAAAGGTPWGAIATGIGGLTKLFGGNSQKGEGRRLLKEIGDSPDEAVPNEVLQNQRMATLRAATGLPSEQYNQAMKNLQRQQLMALRGASDRRGGLSLLAGNQQAYNDALLNLDVANAKARINNENTLYKINQNVAGWKDKVWGNNVRDKWNRKYKYGMSLLGAGNQNASNGTDQLLAGGVSALSGLKFGGKKKAPSGDFVDRTDFDIFQ